MNMNMNARDFGAGTVDSGGREGEADRSDQGTTRGNGIGPEPRPAGGGSHHDLRQPSVLCSHRGRLYDRAVDACHSTHGVRLRSRLHPATKGQHQLETAAPMGFSDRKRKR